MSSKESKKQEKKLAKELNGSVVPASGAIPGIPQDVSTDYFLVEAKYTEGKSFAVNRKYWNGIVEHAFKQGKLPVMIIEFRGFGTDSIVVMRKEEFEDDLNRLREDEL
jgi:Holliday junction resolvase